MFYLFIFEFLGTTELLVILVVALVLFGPRKLPQLSRSLGKSLGEFKRASEEFKQTWEREVAMESVEKERETERAMLPEDNSILGASVGREKSTTAQAGSHLEAGAETVVDEGRASTAAAAKDDATTTARESGQAVSSGQTTSTDATEPTRKRDWL